MGRRIQGFRRWLSGLRPLVRFWVGIAIGVLAGVLLTVLAFKEFSFQIVQAISTTVLAFATVALVLSTSALSKFTGVLAEIERKRDRRSNLRNRIKFAQKILRTPTNHIILGLTSQGYPDPQFEMFPEWIRGLKQLIDPTELFVDTEIHAISPVLEMFSMRMMNVEQGRSGMDFTNLDDPKNIQNAVDVLRRNLPILMDRWRGQMPFLYE